MKISIAFATAFRHNLSQYRARAQRTAVKVAEYREELEPEDSEVLRIPVVPVVPVEPAAKSSTSSSKKDLYLDYGPVPETQNESRGIEPIKYTRKQRVLQQRPDLSKEIQQAKAKIQHEQGKQAEILDKELIEINKVKKLQESIRRSIASEQVVDEQIVGERETSRLAQDLGESIVFPSFMRYSEDYQNPWAE